MSPLRTLAAVAALCTGAAHAGYISNGSFEAETLVNGQWTNRSALTGWLAGPAGVEIRNNVAGAAQDGKMFVELDTTGNSDIWQTITTGSGQHLRLSAWYAPREGVGLDSNDIQVWWGNTLLSTLAGSGAGQSGNQWREFTWDVVGSGTDTLRFSAAGRSDSLGGSLDNISLKAVPEPGSLALVLAAVGCAVAVPRVRRRRA